MSEEAYEAHQARMHARPQVAPQLTLLELRALSFVLQMPPTVNDAWHHIPATGGKALTDEHRQFRTNVISRVRHEMRTDPPLAGRVELTLRLTFNTRRRTDIDNRVKPLQDALTHAKAYHDDSQIDRLIVERLLGPQELCEVTLREIAA
jgi:Holliday junction resolvase RusA-like endonuclease